ncbi:SRPBCC family protein [Glycomyces xiaoerkulensis]|uniref:SRPBCC family protein n=1 Tax=Glycomyces xiaoerkulensis TaxID=2038139 RepID=UPI000C26425A|nr:SRPBCC family protein [Glycomyces xiaoerkulensis]
MEINSDPLETVNLVGREIRSGTRDGEPTKIAVARRRYSAERPDVWDALTNPERLPRWFMPVEGDLSVGGRYQLEGNAGGVIESCTEPEGFNVTWEYGGQVSWLQVKLSDTGRGTLLELTHEAHVDRDFWEQFGPGATGVGWDLGLHGLDQHLTSGADLDPTAAEAWTLSPEGKRFIRSAAEHWAEAAVGDGDDPEQARSAAERTVAFYTTPPEAADQEG